MIDMSEENRREFDAHISNLIRDIDEYNCVASSVLSITGKAKPSELSNRAENLIRSHSKIYGPFTNERFRIFEIARRRVLSEIKRIQPTILLAERVRKHQVGTNRMLVNNFLILAADVLLILTRYFEYLGDTALLKLSLPKSLQAFRRIRRRSYYAVAISGVSLLLTLVGFWPILSVTAGVLSAVWWVIETQYLAPRSLDDLKKGPQVALVAQREMEELQSQITLLQGIANFVNSFDVVWPTDVQQLMMAMDAKETVDSRLVEVASANLQSIRNELQSKQYPGINSPFADSVATSEAGA